MTTNLVENPSTQHPSNSGLEGGSSVTGHNEHAIDAHSTPGEMVAQRAASKGAYGIVHLVR